MSVSDVLPTSSVQCPDPSDSLKSHLLSCSNPESCHCPITTTTLSTNSSKSNLNLETLAEFHEFHDAIEFPQNDSPSISDETAIQLNGRNLTSLSLPLIQKMSPNVSKLSLQANKLSFLPLDIKYFNFLTYLDLSHNNFVDFPLVVC